MWSVPGRGRGLLPGVLRIDIVKRIRIRRVTELIKRARVICASHVCVTLVTPKWVTVCVCECV